MEEKKSFGSYVSQITCKADVWSVVKICFSIFHKEFEFGADATTKRDLSAKIKVITQLINQEFATKTTPLETLLKSIYLQGLVTDPDERISYEQIINTVKA